MLETAAITLPTSTGQQLRKFIINLWIYHHDIPHLSQKNAWIFNKQEDKKMHVRNVPEVRLLSPVLR